MPKTNLRNKSRRYWKLGALLVGLAFVFPRISLHAQAVKAASRQHRNIVIFVADGLRNGSVNPTDAPTMWMFRNRGVYFANSHSLYPTVTTPNGSAIATGHSLGDTKDFGNAMYLGRLFTNEGGTPSRTVTPFLENDQILRQLIQNGASNYMQPSTLLELARQNGYQTAVVGKIGPAGIQDIRNLDGHAAGSSCEIVIDDATNVDANGVPVDKNSPALCKSIAQALASEGLGDQTPPRGANGAKGTKVPNWKQQTYFVDAATKVILPAFERSEKPFVLIYWSRDPDGSQHNQGDSLGSLKPGINGDTSRWAIQNADNNLRQIYNFISSHPDLANNTDFFLTSDHGFATISHKEIDANLTPTTSFAASLNKGIMPPGFLAIDLAHDLHLSFFDSDKPLAPTPAGDAFQKIDPAQGQFPANGNALLGEHVKNPDGSDARIVVTANGGTDLIYIPSKDEQVVRAVVAALARYDYVGGIFVNDEFIDSSDPIPGALPLSAVGLFGVSQENAPSIVVALKVFYLTPGDIQTAIQISDTALLEGQGMHGGLGRDSTFNNMAAIGPDFKVGFKDELPVSNADIVPTLAHILHFDVGNPAGTFGRAISESLAGNAVKLQEQKCVAISGPASGKQTILEYQTLGKEKYFDRAFFEPAAGRQPGCSK
ncbi:MAG: alkaline phosphatase family protein [Candidatus Acidiferrales bacterium]